MANLLAKISGTSPAQPLAEQCDVGRYCASQRHIAGIAASGAATVRLWLYPRTRNLSWAASISLAAILALTLLLLVKTFLR